MEIRKVGININQVVHLDNKKIICTKMILLILKI